MTAALATTKARYLACQIAGIIEMGQDDAANRAAYAADAKVLLPRLKALCALAGLNARTMVQEMVAA